MSPGLVSVLSLSPFSLSPSPLSLLPHIPTLPSLLRFTLLLPSVDNFLLWEWVWVWVWMWRNRVQSGPVFGDGGRGHKPKDVNNLWKWEKTRKQIYSQNFQKEYSPATDFTQ